MTLQTTLLRFKFDDFEDLPSEPGKFIDSEKQIDCNGNAWKLKVCPGGNGGDGSDVDCFTSLYLHNDGTHEKHVKCSFIVRSANGLAACNKKMDHSFEAGQWLGYSKFVKRSFILDATKNILVDGALIIDVDIQTPRDITCYHVPPNPFAKNMLMLLDSGNLADVSFKINRTTIHAHKLILGVSAPILANYCEGAENDSPIVIKNASVEVFRHVLRYVYGGDVPNEKDVLRIGKEIIDAADRFDVVGLKLAVEAHLVACCVIDESNVVDYLLFAHSKTCPLLKEYAISYFVRRANDIINSKSMKKLESTELLPELMAAVVKNSDSIARVGGTGFEKMTVDELRKKLDEDGLDVDGSREMLVARIKSPENNKKRPREE